MIEQKTESQKMKTLDEASDMGCYAIHFKKYESLTVILSEGVISAGGVVVDKVCFFFFQAEDGIRGFHVTGVQTCALPIFGIAIGAGTDVAVETADVVLV